MRKRTIAVGVTALIALTGCSPTDEQETTETTSSAAETTSAGEGPRGFQFESGFLEFGDFDPGTLGDDIFNPCTEITPEEYAAAGFDAVVHDPSNDETFGRGLSFCVIDELRDDGFAHGFSNNRVNRAVIEENATIMSEYTSQVLPEMYVYSPQLGGEGLCFTQVDTLRGGFGTQAGGPSARVSREEACGAAITEMENLFAAHGTG